MVEFELIHDDSILIDEDTHFDMYVLWKGEVSFDGILIPDYMNNSPFKHVFIFPLAWINYNIPGLFGRNHINRLIDRNEMMNEVDDLDELEPFDDREQTLDEIIDEDNL